MGLTACLTAYLFRAKVDKLYVVEELDKVKEQLKGNVVLAMENTYNRMSQLAKQELYLDRHYTIDEVLDMINQVNKEQ